MATLPNISCNYYKIGMKKKNKFFLCFILIMLLLTVGNSSNTPDERLALNDLRTALNDTQNLLKDWDIYLSTPCDTWSRISCRNGHVVSLGLSSCGFTGTLSPSITNLKYLEKLELQDNNLKGELPDYLGKMLNLNSLDLGRNSFTGSIPKTWDQLGTHLTYLDLSFNSLNGRVPKQLFDVSIFNFTGNHLMCDNSGNQQPCVSSSISMGSVKKSKMEVAMISASITAFFLLLLGSIYTYTRKRSHKSISDKFFDVAGEDDRKFTFGQVKRFSWREIQLATNNFSEANIIGQGGFGKVYKGVLMDGTKVAVKRLMDYNNPGGEAAFLREIQLISVAVHKNLLRLIGFCTTSWERILVYPFMQNLSVAYRLRELKPGEKGLDWEIRKRIALGTAHGLEYLHEKCNPKIIHRDLKAANILLDENFDAVLGDFGLAKVVDSKLTHVTTQVRGTMGHIAPEYLTTGKSSEKTDVFGYGVSLLELVTGQRAIDFARLEEEEDVLLLDHIKKLLRESRIHDIVDSKMKAFDPKEAEMMLKVALLCAQSEPERRPKMDEVVNMLRGGGLEERWAQWETVEEDRMNQELTQMAHLFPWADESTDDQESLQLSSAR